MLRTPKHIVFEKKLANHKKGKIKIVFTIHTIITTKRKHKEEKEKDIEEEIAI